MKEKSSKEILLKRFVGLRAQTEALCEPLEIEDYSVQPNLEVSPPKWHLAHTTWFFEQFVLTEFVSEYEVFNESYAYFFNSYYNNAGERILRPNRGIMTRPTVAEVLKYRTYVTNHVVNMLQDDCSDEVLELIEIGINHEEQHQELLVYDIKFILGDQPSFPVYPSDLKLTSEEHKTEYIEIPEGLYQIGHQNNTFCFDNELAVHKVYLNHFEIATKLVTNREYLEFMDAGGYQNFNYWHAEGWEFIQEHNINAPLYWQKVDGAWLQYQFEGRKPVNLEEPVCHISYFEAFAYAEWKGLRLPTEFEWEIASSKLAYRQLWEWTSSAYLPYPNYTKAPGAIGEYNGKFMVNQHVLRGASYATPKGHSRPTYRNFFHPNMRWLFSGIRLVK